MQKVKIRYIKTGKIKSMSLSYAEILVRSKIAEYVTEEESLEPVIPHSTNNTDSSGDEDTGGNQDNSQPPAQMTTRGRSRPRNS